MKRGGGIYHGPSYGEYGRAYDNSVGVHAGDVLDVSFFSPKLGYAGTQMSNGPSSARHTPRTLPSCNALDVFRHKAEKSLATHHHRVEKTLARHDRHDQRQDQRWPKGPRYEAEIWGDMRTVPRHTETRDDDDARRSSTDRAHGTRQSVRGEARQSLQAETRRYSKEKEQGARQSVQAEDALMRWGTKERPGSKDRSSGSHPDRRPSYDKSTRSRTDRRSSRERQSLQDGSQTDRRVSQERGSIQGNRNSLTMPFAMATGQHDVSGMADADFEFSGTSDANPGFLSMVNGIGENWGVEVPDAAEPPPQTHSGRSRHSLDIAELSPQTRSSRSRHSLDSSKSGQQRSDEISAASSKSKSKSRSSLPNMATQQLDILESTLAPQKNDSPAHDDTEPPAGGTLEDLWVSCNGRNKEALDFDEAGAAAQDKQNKKEARRRSRDKFMSGGSEPRTPRKNFSHSGTAGSKGSQGFSPPASRDGSPDSQNPEKQLSGVVSANLVPDPPSTLQLTRIQEKINQAKKDLVSQEHEFDQKASEKHKRGSMRSSAKSKRQYEDSDLGLYTTDWPSREPEEAQEEDRCVYLKFTSPRRRTIE